MPMYNSSTAVLTNQGTMIKDGRHAVQSAYDKHITLIALMRSLTCLYSVLRRRCSHHINSSGNNVHGAKCYPPGSTKRQIDYRLPSITYYIWRVSKTPAFLDFCRDFCRDKNLHAWTIYFSKAVCLSDMHPTRLVLCTLTVQSLSVSLHVWRTSIVHNHMYVYIYTCSYRSRIQAQIRIWYFVGRHATDIQRSQILWPF